MGWKREGKKMLIMVESVLVCVVVICVVWHVF